jgi:hypothetical protein
MLLRSLLQFRPRGQRRDRKGGGTDWYEIFGDPDDTAPFYDSLSLALIFIFRIFQEIFSPVIVCSSQENKAIVHVASFRHQSYLGARGI